MGTLPSANKARMCQTIESPMITASRSVSQRGAKRLRVEISKTGGGEVVKRGVDRIFHCCTQGPVFPGAGVKDIWEDRFPGVWGLCRETHGVEVVGVLAARVSPRCFQHCFPFPQLGLLPKQLLNLSLHGLQLQLYRMQREHVLTSTQRSKGHKSAIKASNS